MHLRYETDEETVHKICLMFKRAPELKPYYKSIKSWCEENKLRWKGKVFNHNRYMEIHLNPYLDEITKTIFDAKQTIFKVKAITVGANSIDIDLALQGKSRLLLRAFMGLAVMVTLGLFPIYELFRLPYLGKPSLNAIDWPELFLVLLFVMGFFPSRQLNQNTTRKKHYKRKTLLIARVAFLLVVASAFFTY